ncbi:pilus assembly protein [Myxococcus xanthus]|uniref:DUF4114 domain-containing protein n=1 Tax=Myxococcus xanthus TaxID=34 RepID=UPI0011268A2F|nr:DUF4114 domain-containing protein [Myxococcus xanthus]QDE87773.1 pilus assembly protein [Myxococcus xanthus]
MRTLIQTLAAVTLLTAPLASAQTTPESAPAQLCENQLDQNKQPEFSEENLEIESSTVLITEESPARLQLNTNRTALNVENIYFPFDQNVTISYVYESAGASHALGYLYMDDLRVRGYVDSNGNLVDSNNNGIFDLHEDMFNLAPRSGSKARPYIGESRRCTRNFTSDGETYNQPELAMNSECRNTFDENHREIADARPGYTFEYNITDVVGAFANDRDNPGGAFSDRGLFPHIPNLLEPPSDRNGNLGLGRMVFLLADDDDGRSTYGNLSPVPDTGDYPDGIPDYDVSHYDPRGLPRANNPDRGISPYDRTVDLGMIEGGKEVVFFVVVFYSSRNHGPNEGYVYPCLKQDPDGRCALHLRTSINVFFSKAAWNMDQNPEGGTIVAERNIGCQYLEGCNRDNPASTPGEACRVQGTNEYLCGWLDGPIEEQNTTLYRLANDELYGRLVMPMERVTIPRPGGVRNAMPHVIVGAPTTDPFRWILGFEDIPGGGDRDFNDVVFVVNKQNGGSTRSATVSGDLSPDIANDFVITKVRFKRQDDFAPAPRTCAGGAPCFSEDVPGACTPEDGPEPTIAYSLAVDCRVCRPHPDTGQMECVPNPNSPTWFPVHFPDTSPPTQEVELDIMAMGFTGSQLCWKVDITSPNEQCRPIIDDVEVGYQAVRAGSYSRASPSTLANVVVWGVNETPGSAWGRSGAWPGAGMPAPGTRAYDGQKDFTIRGRLYFRSLYDPEEPSLTRAVQRWDAGKVMAMSFGTNGHRDDPLQRKLYTMSASGGRSTITDEMSDTSSNSLLFPDALCDEERNGRYLYDLNNDGKCGTPSSASDEKRITGVTNDRNFLREWLYGWEDRHAPGTSDDRRPWALGGINMSTVAISVPPYLDTWANNARASERDLYRRNFLERLADRPTVAFVGTMNGYLHAFDAGEFRNSTHDPCNSQTQARGYFEATTCNQNQINSRDYGSGQERFAYLPRMLLSQYRNLYVRFNGSGALSRPSMDASPSIANVDFGIPNTAAWTRSTTASKTQGAKTVLVSGSGKNSPAVIALDITHPDDAWYPLPLWEFDLRSSNIEHAFSTAKVTTPEVQLPDNSGTNHAPSIGRLVWGSEAEGKWTAVVGTSQVPSSPGRAGTLYLIDMKTGQPLNYGSSSAGAMAGIITLDTGSGIAAETALVDLDRDGNYDVMYVPTTAGNVYRVNLDQVNPNAPLGQKVKVCKIASAPVTLSDHDDAAEGQDPVYQQIHSNLGVRIVRNSGSPVVRFYFGTGDNPDEFSDGPENKNAYRYHLLGYEDTDPSGTRACALLDPLWVQQLDPGQAVWGGVTLADDKVYATTAVGAAADVCNLSQDESGRFYESGLLPDGNSAPSMTSASLGGHGVSAPVVHDNHLFIPTATGEVKVQGSGKWGNGNANGGAARSKVLIYAPSPDGRMPQ